MRTHENQPIRRMSPVAIVFAGCLCLAAPAWGQNGWSPLRAGLNASTYSQAVFDDGSGPALYVGGAFNTAGGVNVNRIAKWGPGAPGYWSPLGSWMSGGISGLPFALTVFDDGSGPALYAGGWFTTAGGVSADHIARWGFLSACPCSCDFDPQPQCDIFDFLAFQTLFVARDPCACQQDPDPHCNIFDFLAWQTQFVSGCP